MPEGDQPTMSVSKPVPTYEEDEVEKTPKPTKPRNNERKRGGGANRQQPSRDSDKSASKTNSERRGTRVTSRPVPTPAPVKNRNAWYIPPIHCDEPGNGVFYAQMGPTGGKHGYPAITGHVGWGISWYINGLLIPVINVVRGKTYTFVVEGGLDPDIPAKYHPFYITDDSIGGYQYKTEEERKNVRIFAGARQGKDGNVNPTAVGRLCHWTHQGDKDADDFESFGAYQRTLELICDEGEPGVLQWTPDKDTPDTVYYQCFTHRYLGWKINVLDECDREAVGSELHETIVEPDPMDLDDSPSLRIETRIKPNDIEEVLVKDQKLPMEKMDVEEDDGIMVIKIEDPEPTQPILTQELPKVDNDWSFKTQDDIKPDEYFPLQVPGNITLAELKPPGK